MWSNCTSPCYKLSEISRAPGRISFRTWQSLSLKNFCEILNKINLSKLSKSKLGIEKSSGGIFALKFTLLMWLWRNYWNKFYLLIKFWKLRSPISNFISSFNSFKRVVIFNGFKSGETPKESVETYQLIIKSQPTSEDARFFLQPNYTFEKGIKSHNTMLLSHFIQFRGSDVFLCVCWHVKLC